MQIRNKLILFIALQLGAATVASASVPDWLRQVAKEPVPAYKAETNGVVLLDEEITTVTENGEIQTVYRRAVKILRPNAREDLSRVYVPFDIDTKITWMKGWSITSTGQEYEMKEKDAVEVAVSSEFMSDNRAKILMIPGAEVGTVIGYEYQQKRRPSVFQDVWFFQESLPVRFCRYTLRLPSGWEYKTFFDNHAPVEPAQTGTDYTWQVSDVPELEREDYMPPYRAIAGRMVLHFYRAGSPTNTSTWDGVANWEWNLVRDRANTSPEIKQKVSELTASSKTTREKIEALSNWVHKEIRYVDIEIGIGGFQPHYASDVFRNRYGDCKDKAVLLTSMLKEIGVESEYVLIHSMRGLVSNHTPSALTFNHAITAIRLSADVSTTNLNALYKDDKLGTLLIYDPTNDSPFGDLPDTLQKTYALLIHNGEGKIIETPLLPPSVNMLQRAGEFKLTPDGNLSGEIQEARTGAIGTAIRGRLLAAEQLNRAKTVESILAGNLGSYQLTSAVVGDLEEASAPLILKYKFNAPEYAKKTGPLMLVRPRVVGQKTWSIMEGKKRLYPVEFDNASLETDTFEIELPPNYVVDELPDPVKVTYDFGEYQSKVEQVGSKLKYSRVYTIKQVMIPTERLDDLKKFYRQIAGDERSTVVLKQKM